MIQCATCINEPIVIVQMAAMWPEQEMFNTNFLKYQNMARKYECRDYMKAWC